MTKRIEEIYVSEVTREITKAVSIRGPLRGRTLSEDKVGQIHS